LQRRTPLLRLLNSKLTIFGSNNVRTWKSN